MTHKIVLTGGGTAGHVTPNLALIEVLQQEGWQIDYVGSKDGVEKSMIEAINIPYHEVNSGKFRRYFSWKTLLEPLKISLGIFQSFRLLRKLKSDIVFSKGGFVAFPVVVGAWLNRIPIVAHESDITPGLANRLSLPFANKICVTFAAAEPHFKHKDKVKVTGTPIRKNLLQGNKERGLSLCEFNDKKPCILIIGGSLGANVLNICIRNTLEDLCKDFQVIHLCGKDKVDLSIQREGYWQLEYAREELADLFAASDFIISRAGANSLYEILALGKPHVLVPLSKKASRGDQIQNAQYFKQKEISVVIDEENLAPEVLLSSIQEVLANQDKIKAKINALQIRSATAEVMAVIQETLHAESTKTI
jgi:UDP-N-acetylglucosamine--N-acetylmuramyl-(pentapeptide) pyrophosphoryl-undecaprenol N-acetylglucosamine transferase